MRTLSGLPADERLFAWAVGASLAAHILLWGAAALWLRDKGPGSFPVLEVDLSAPFRPRLPGDTRLPGSAKGAPAPAPKPMPGGPGRLKTEPAAAAPIETAPDAPKPATPPKEWVLPGPGTQVLEDPAPPSPPPAPPAPVGGGPGGTGTGG